jgi:hypothetical protein
MSISDDVIFDLSTIEDSFQTLVITGNEALQIMVNYNYTISSIETPTEIEKVKK